MQTTAPLTRNRKGVPFRWRDALGLVHAVRFSAHPVEKDRLVPITRCGLRPISAGETWAGTDRLSCRACKVLETAVKERPPEGRPEPKPKSRV